MELYNWKLRFPFLLILALSVQTFSSCTKQSTLAEPLPQSTEVGISASHYWTKLLDSAAWRKNYNFQMFSVEDEILVFHPDGTWRSKDGTTWEKARLGNAIKNLAFLDYVQFKGSIYGLGYFEGNVERFQFKSEIYRTTNLVNWSILATDSNLPKRFFYHPFVFKDKIWIIGGEDSQRKYADIWNSEDGIHWVKQKDNLPFGERSGSQIVQLEGVLYLLNNDVWRSNDGTNWELVTKEIIAGEEIFGYSAVVLDGRIWLLGCNRNGQFSSQVLFSKDGKHWQTQQAPWAPRGGIAATVHKGKIYMTGGKYGGTPNHPDFRYDNDVWVLEKRLSE